MTEPNETAKGRQTRDELGRWLPGRSGTPPSCRHGSHGQRALRETLRQLAREANWLENLGDLGEVAREWRDELYEDRGGTEAVSLAEKMIVEGIVVRRLLIESASRYLLATPTAILDRRKQRLKSLVFDLEKLLAGQTRDLQAIGLARRTKPSMSLSQYLQKKQELNPPTGQGDKDEMAQHMAKVDEGEEVTR